MIRKSLLLFAVNTTGRAFQYVYRVVMSYFLTLKEFGVLSASLPYQSFVLLFTSMSITPTVSKVTSEYRIHEKEKIFNVFSLLMMGLIIGGILYLFTEFLSHFFGAEFSESESLLRILAAGVPFAVLLSICTGIFLGFERSELMAGFLFLYQCLMVLFSAILVEYQGLHGAAEGILLGYAVTGVAAFLVVFTFKIPVTVALQEIMRIMRFFLPVLGGVVGLWALLNVDILILARFVSAEDVGIYGMAFPTARLIFGFSVGLSALLIPKLSELTYRGKDTQQSVRSALEACTLVTLPLSVALAAFSKEILYVLFGVLEGHNSLGILSFGMLFYSLFFVGYSALQGKGFPHYSMGAALLSGACCIILCFLLIPSFSLVGAACATSLSCIIGLCIILYLLKTLFVPRIHFIVVMLPLFIFEHVIGVLESRITTMVVYSAWGLPFILLYFYLSRKYIHVRE
ncbi:MAG: flippase [Theionarchaea archaeon]|nr:flippase [Theionarchaea archaeon]